VNDQWRLVFKWNAQAEATDVQLRDYH
jgi:plasmid maintenance system killer protein